MILLKEIIDEGNLTDHGTDKPFISTRISV